MYKEYETYQDVSSYLKTYPKFIRLIKYDQPIKVKIKGFEESQKQIKIKHSGRPNPECLVESIRRSKTTLTDLTICNEFDLFVTFTFAKDRQNADLLKRRMSQWLKNEKLRHGYFQYVIVPEFHKDKKSIHFHALFKNYKGTLLDSHHRINNRKAYNIKSYTLGYSTAVKIDNIKKVSSYIRKYITKDMPKFEKKKRYWCSTKLQRPTITANPDIDPFTYSQLVEKWKKVGLTIYEAQTTITNVKLNNWGNEWKIQLSTLSMMSSYQLKTAQRVIPIRC